MLAPDDNTTTSLSEQAAGPMNPPARSLASSWARGRREITPWAYPHLRVLAAVRFAVGIFVTCLGAVMLAHGYDALAAVPLAGAVLLFSIAYLDSTVVRSAAYHA